MQALSGIWNSIQSWLFPSLESELDELTDKQKRFVEVCELCELQKHMGPYQYKGTGAPPRSRLALFKSFIAKAVYNFPTTVVLIEHLKGCTNLRRLCGYESVGEIPSESTFSRAFAQFSAGELPQRIHEAMIKTHYEDKLVGHISRDSAAIEAREKAAPKPPKSPKIPRKRGRPKKGEVRAPKPPRRLELQPDRTLQENLDDLPKLCDSGCKRNSKGKTMYWRGYKLHIDAADGDVPISPLLTSASTHDSQAAIPLAQMSHERVTNLYDLMDAAYDAKEIRKFSEGYGHVPIIDHNPKAGEKVEMTPAQKRRFDERTGVERVFSHLEHHGRDTVRVRGASKIMAHLMFGIIVVAAEQMFNMLL